MPEKCVIRSHLARKGLLASAQRIAWTSLKPKSVPKRSLESESFLALLL